MESDSSGCLVPRTRTTHLKQADDHGEPTCQAQSNANLSDEIGKLHEFMTQHFSRQEQMLNLLLERNEGETLDLDDPDGQEGAEEEQAQDTSPPSCRRRTVLDSFEGQRRFSTAGQEFHAKLRQTADMAVIRMRSQIAPDVEEELEDEQCHPREELARFLERPMFQHGILVLILLNIVMIGIEVDTIAPLPEDQAPSWFGILNSVIVMLFIIEITLKCVACGCREFFCGTDRNWNIFDFVVVSLSVVEVLIDLVVSQLIPVSLSNLRTLRVLRLARVLRGMKALQMLRFVGALRTLMLAIMNTLASLIWTLVLLALVTYSFAVSLTQLVSDHCRLNAISMTGDTNATPFCEGQGLNVYWSTLSRSMLTLFMSVSGGISWNNALEPLSDIGWMAVAVLIAYVSITLFAVLNVVTGVFCNTAIESANMDREVATMSQIQNAKALSEDFRAIFAEVDVDHSCSITIDEFELALGDERLKAFFEAMGIASQDAWKLFTVMDHDQNGTVDPEEFVKGCLQLRGPAKAVHIALMMVEHYITSKSVKRLEDKVEEMQRMIESVKTKPVQKHKYL